MCIRDRLQAGATPIYLETARNPFGFIGGIDEKCFDEEYLRSLVREKCPEKADAKRPFRLDVYKRQELGNLMTFKVVSA